MKKVFKGLSILVASTALCAGIATASACSGGYNGTYYGEYHYQSAHGVYGVVVEVSVNNNVITKVKNITNTENEYAVSVQKDAEGNAQKWTYISSANPTYGWSDVKVANWNDNESWLLQQYEGKAVADILDLAVYTKYAYKSDGNGNMVPDIDNPGEPYEKDHNAELLSSGLIITDATQGSGRVLIAVQNALKK